MPEVIGLPEEGAKADRHSWGDGPFAVNDFIDGTWCYPDGACHGILGDAHGYEVFLKQDLTGCNVLIHDDVTYNVIGVQSMVIYNGNAVGAVFGPLEDDTPLLVDANRVMPCEIPFECF